MIGKSEEYLPELPQTIQIKNSCFDLDGFVVCLCARPKCVHNERKRWVLAFDSST